MATTVRKGVFETNSSSTHSISLEQGNEWDTIEPEEDGVIRLYEKSFGWEWKMYNDARTKAEYCLTDLVDRELLKEVIQEFTGYEVEFYDNDECYGIDHQSYGTVRGKLHTKEQLTNFIFNKSSLLFTGNDNDEAPYNFYDPIEKEYNWELHINNEVFKFEEYPTKDEIEDILDIYLVYYEEFINVDIETETYTIVDMNKFKTTPEQRKDWKEVDKLREEFIKNPKNWEVKSYKIINRESTKQI